jgi:polysaccharide pyruvyl transferase WcaK-like protein
VTGLQPLTEVITDARQGDSIVKKILIAEGLPLANKGEEAILRGIQDMLYPDEDVQIGILDYVSEPVTRGWITIFPYEWLYPYARPLRSRPLNMPPLSFKQKLFKLCSILLMPAGYLGASAMLLRNYSGPMNALADFANAADLILVGHDGAFGLESCPVLLAAKKNGKRTGILGSGTSIPRGYWSAPIARWMYAKAIKASDFAFFRECTTYKFMLELSGGSSKVKIAPDPAFAMRPAPMNDVVDCLQREDWYRKAKSQNRYLVLATVCENSVVFMKSFPDVKDDATKRSLHALRLARIMDRLVKEGATVVFLPHSTDKGRGNDMAVAADVIACANEKDHLVLWESALDARMLKGVIAAADFIVGERTHSLIGAVSVSTPFAALTNRHDQRTHDIIGTMCECPDLVLNIDSINEAELVDGVIKCFHKRVEIEQRLKVISARLRLELATVADSVRPYQDTGTEEQNARNA